MSVIAARLSFGMISRRRMIAMSTIGMSVGLTAVMSLLFNHTLRIDMMTTGFVCALVIHKVLARITGHYRRQLAVANQTLERRVHERTIELEDANTALHRAAALEASLRDELMVRDRMACGHGKSRRSAARAVRYGGDSCSDAPAARTSARAPDLPIQLPRPSGAAKYCSCGDWQNGPCQSPFDMHSRGTEYGAPVPCLKVREGEGQVAEYRHLGVLVEREPGRR